MLKPTHITARNLSTLWFDLLVTLFTTDRCRIWTIKGTPGEDPTRSHIGSGSFIGDQRWEFDFVTVHVTHPGERPLLPDNRPGVPNPVPGGMKYVEDYYNEYIMGTDVQENETYTYGSRIAPQVQPVIDKFLDGGWGTNQCTIEVAQPEDIYLPDPPCLRMLDFRIYPDDGLRSDEFDEEGKPLRALHMTCYFRSWDLWGGLPANLAGLRLLQEDMAQAMDIEAGDIFAISKGLHLYGSTVAAALERIGEHDVTIDDLIQRIRRDPRGCVG